MICGFRRLRSHNNTRIDGTVTIDLFCSQFQQWAQDLLLFGVAGRRTDRQIIPDNSQASKERLTMEIECGINDRGSKLNTKGSSMISVCTGGGFDIRFAEEL